ncbi:versican core protein-like [Antedon mediterranea]|uniref:versican core protein-like n=1 Tax=Antedon mediterranea TaxID=105859 RepID=UPI003AF78D3E
MNLTCDICWLISGEVTFSNDQTMCELVNPDLRCNLYPDRTSLYSCFYCYINPIIMPFGIDYHSDCRILHISYDSTQGYHYADAETRCRDEFNGHLALPMELYNVSVNGVKSCEIAWFSNNLISRPENAEICWENAITGNKFRIVDPTIYYKPAYCSLLNVEPGAYPYPDHGVIFVTPKDSFRNVLNYTQAMERCTEIGGSLASENQMRAANQAGYQQLRRGWINDKYVAYSCVHGCSPLGVTVSKGQKLESNQNDAFCHIPKT